MEYLFSYGTLQNSDVQIELFGCEVNFAMDVMTGYEVRTITLGNGTHKLAVEHAGGQISGILLELTAEQIAICDEYEPEEYERVSVGLLSGKTAWAYVAAKNEL